MNLKTYILSSVLVCTLFSCSNDIENTNESNLSAKKEILNFGSENEMNAKIAEIEAFKANQDQQILEKILQRNHITAPTLAEAKKISNKTITEADKIKMLEDVKFYHQEKLNAIYAERAHFGFTSIQSIADEINFSKLINPTKANSLLKENAELLIIDKDFASTNSKIALVSNAQGKYMINNTVIKQEPVKSNISRFIQDSQIKQGVLASNGFFAVTWHVGVSEHRGDIGNTYYGNFSQFGGFVLGSLYPTWFYPSANSTQRFVRIGTINPVKERYVAFPTSAGTIVRNEDVNSFSTEYWNQYSPLEGFVGGNFATIINGQVITISGSHVIN